MQYPLKEKIGHPDLLVGREEEFNVYVTKSFPTTADFDRELYKAQNGCYCKKKRFPSINDSAEKGQNRLKVRLLTSGSD
ncbi:MAG: hypothetical protein AAF639_08290 [Chloroflexota bacterium]